MTSADLTTPVRPASDERELAVAREAIYRRLAGLFLHPPAHPLPFVDPAERRALAALSPGLAAALDEIEGVDLDPKALSDEFHALFVVPAPGYVSPLASVLLDAHSSPDRSRRRGLLLGPSSRAVESCYASAGFRVDGIDELPDHIGVELSFMALLCEEEGKAWQQGLVGQANAWRERQCQFLCKHLAPFASRLSDALDVARPSPYFRVTVALLRAIMEHDQLLLSAHL